MWCVLSCVTLHRMLVNKWHIIRCVSCNKHEKSCALRIPFGFRLGNEFGNSTTIIMLFDFKAYRIKCTHNSRCIIIGCATFAAHQLQEHFNELFRFPFQRHFVLFAFCNRKLKCSELNSSTDKHSRGGMRNETGIIQITKCWCRHHFCNRNLRICWLYRNIHTHDVSLSLLLLLCVSLWTNKHHTFQLTKYKRRITNAINMIDFCPELTTSILFGCVPCNR